MGDLFKYLPIIMRLFTLAPQLIDALRQGKIIEFLRGQGGSELWEMLLSIGGQFWPELSPEQQVEAATLKTFDQPTVKAVQAGLNKLGVAKLVVDGDYGTKTKKAVETFQKTNKLTVDGWAGSETQAAIQVAVNKLPKAPVPQ